MKHMVSSGTDCSIPPGSDDDVVKERALVVVCEKIWNIRASNSTSLLFIVSMGSLCRAHAITKHEEFQQLTQGERHVLHYKSSV